MSYAPKKEEWDDWLTHPCTVALREIARRRQQSFMENWASGAFTEDLGLNAKAIGECQAYAAVQTLDYVSMVETELVEEKASAKPDDRTE